MIEHFEKECKVPQKLLDKGVPTSVSIYIPSVISRYALHTLLAVMKYIVSNASSYEVTCSDFASFLSLPFLTCS
jgi:hypothetical protein